MLARVGAAVNDSPTMPISSIAPWFGGKRTLAPVIVEELGQHYSYVEPFCGSLAVILAKPVATQELVNDLHGDLTNLARVIASPAAFDLYDRLQRTIMAEGLYLDALEYLKVPLASGIDRSRAYWYFIASWMGRNGTAGLRRTNWQISVRWTPTGGSSPTRFRAAVESLPAWNNRLRSVEILQRDGLEVLAKLEDGEGVAIYADPPYFTRGARTSTSSRYAHEFTPEQHARLSQELRRFRKARVVVSYYEDPELEALYPGWTFRNCDIQKNLHVQNRRGSGKCQAPEVLILNGPSYAGQQQLFAGDGQ
jgi:DNA adenine methylase